MATFGALLRQYRERAGLSCNELARGAGVDPSYVSRLELGQREPPRRRVVADLADALGLADLERGPLFGAAGYVADTDALAQRLAALQARLGAVALELSELRRLVPGVPDRPRVAQPPPRPVVTPETEATWATVRRLAAGEE